MSVRVEVPRRGAGPAPEWQRIEAPSPAELPTDVPVETVDGEVRYLDPASLAEGGGLVACVACGHSELYTQKDFPRPLGIGIVVVAAVLAPFTYYLSLGVAAVLDLVLYVAGGDVVSCYVCNARHLGFPPEPRHPRFDREIEERLKFGERAVMGKPMRPGGTANAPEPEH